MSIKASNSRFEVNLENLTFRTLILQTTWFTVCLHDLLGWLGRRQNSGHEQWVISQKG